MRPTDNARQTRAPPGLQSPNLALFSHLASASASGFADRARCAYLTTPATAGAPGLTATKLLRSLPPRQRERSRARRSRTLRSPGNFCQRGRPSGWQPPNCCVPFLLANASAPGLANRARCVHLTTPANAGAPGLAATRALVISSLLANASASGLADRARCVHLTTPASAGAPGLTATKLSRSLSPRRRERTRVRRSHTLRSLNNSRQRGRPRAYSRQAALRSAFHLANASAPGPAARSSCLHSTTSANAGAPGFICRAWLPLAFHQFDTTSQESRRRSIRNQVCRTALCLTRGPIRSTTR
jgi:hypothetical protein